VDIARNTIRKTWT